VGIVTVFLHVRVVDLVHLKAIFHCSRFDREGGATNFNHVKNQSRGHAKKVERSSTFMACLRAFKRTKNAQDRQLQRKLSSVRPPARSRAKRLQWKITLKFAIKKSTRSLTKIEYMRNKPFLTDSLLHTPHSDSVFSTMPNNLSTVSKRSEIKTERLAASCEHKHHYVFVPLHANQKPRVLIKQ
jgi:hypothetical protein